jgi:hypothetical protein
MVEFETDIPTPDGAMNSFVVHPEEGGPHPVVPFYMDAHGWRDELRDMCRRLASAGYCVLPPSPYCRRSRGLPPPHRVDRRLSPRADGHRARRLAAPPVRPHPGRGLRGVRLDRQVGAARDRGCARAGHAPGRHALPAGVVPGLGAWLRVPAARGHLPPALRRAALGAAVRAVRQDAAPLRESASGTGEAAGQRVPRPPQRGQQHARRPGPRQPLSRHRRTAAAAAAARRRPWPARATATRACRRGR